MLSFNRFMRSNRSNELRPEPTETPVSPSSQPSPPRSSSSSPSRSPNSSPKVKPIDLRIITSDIEVQCETSPPARTASRSSPTTIRPSSLSVDCLPPSASSSFSSIDVTPSSPPSSPSSPTGRGNPSNQSQMRGFSVMSFRLKQLVSKEKRRFEEDGFNLDLTYVTSRLIAFGYPAESFEGIYRNHYKDVYNFFERRHGANYRIYNLCSERCYDKEKFHCRVGEYRFDDHCPPPLALFRPFCEDVQAWLEKDPEHVAAIHCKAGKGRTGVMICAYMVYAGLWASAHGAMEFFGSARSKKGEGVTIPSQRRFIRYFEAMCRNGRRAEIASSGEGETKRNSDDDSARTIKEREMTQTEYMTQWEEAIEGRGLALFIPRLPRPAPILPPSVKLVLTGIKICGVYSHKRMDPRIRVECGQTSHEFEGPFNYSRPRGFTTDSSESARYSPSTLESASKPDTPPQSPSSGACVDMELDCDRKCVVSDEVKVILRHRNGNKIGHFWFHASFVEQSAESRSLELVLAKHEIDHAVKDIKKGHKKFASSFEIRLRFDHATAADIAASAAAKAPAKRPSPATQSVEPSPSEQAKASDTKPTQTQPKLRSSLPQKHSEGSLFAASKSESSTRASPNGKLAIRPRSKSDTLHLHSIATIGSTTSGDTTGTAAGNDDAVAVVATTPKSAAMSKSPGLSSRFFSMRKREVSIDVSTAGDSKSPSH